MSKIIKVSTDLEVTVHDFPQGTIRERNRQLCELIGNGCEMIEHVMPRRLYNELSHTTEVKCENSKCVEEETFNKLYEQLKQLAWKAGTK